MSKSKDHPYISELKRKFRERRIGRRDFLRTATLLGVSAASASTWVGQAIGATAPPMSRSDFPRGGKIRIGLRIRSIENPHSFTWSAAANIVRQVSDYLTKTGQDNTTRPNLLERWEVSEDLSTWTLHLRKDVRWHSGRTFEADDVIWNLEHVLDERTGSSVIGLMKSYMLEEVEEDGQRRLRLWDASAIEKVDAHTVRLNCKVPQLAVPEHLFHYPLVLLDPEEGGVFGPSSNGLGAFELVEHEVGVRSMLRARKDYWGEGPYVDTLEFIDLGDDPAASIHALAQKRVHGLELADQLQVEALRLMPHLELYQTVTAQTGVARGKVTEKPFDDPRVRKALRLAVDPETTHELVFSAGLGLPAEHHHVSPIHPEYAALPPMERDVAAARKLLAEAGYPDGLDLGRIDCIAAPAWELATVRALVEQWREIGVRVEINVMASKEFWEIWDKARFSFTGWAHRPLGVMVLQLAYRSGVPWNESEYSNPEFDRLLTKAEGILDVEQRRAVMAELQELMQEDGPIVQPLWIALATFMDKRVMGFEMHPTRYIFGNELAIQT